MPKIIKDAAYWKRYRAINRITINTRKRAYRKRLIEELSRGPYSLYY